MADGKFVLAEALAGVDPARAKQIEEQFHNLESGFTQASQKAAELERASKEWGTRETEYRQAINSFNTFFEEWNKQQENGAGPGAVRDPNTGQFASRREQNRRALPLAYDPEEIDAVVEDRVKAGVSAIRDEIFAGLNKEKAEFGQQVYTNTGQMLQWERQLAGIRRMDPEADEKVITDVARAKGLRDLNDAYYLAYGRKNMERVARESAEKAAQEATKETEARLRREFTQHQIEGAGALSGAAARVVRGTAGADVPKNRVEAEAKAVQALSESMYGMPKA